ncbi:MAG TPA: pilus assembly protein [Deltaproteobacteria bacterium]|jgi:Flp pilus assembly protein TadG|nr:pilus assembly protein [Deltaproteobacteria bacterium]
MPIRNHRGAAIVEFCLVLPILLVIVFAIIDFGRLVQARFIITSLAREGGNLASRGIDSGTDLITMLQSGATPLDVINSGKICISSIQAGLTAASPLPVISTTAPQLCAGNLTVASGISAGAPNLGLTAAIYGHLVFKPANQTADINGVTVIEAFYMYTPITPLPKFITGLLLNNGSGVIISSRSVYCTVTAGE